MGKGTVLVVDDETSVADLYTRWLSDEYEVRTAYSGAEALDAFDAEVDIVLLDRRMPDFSGDEVLEAMHERGLDCRVAMVTAVEPDFDVIEMGFDDYLVKPVTAEDLRRTIDRLLTRSTYDEQVREYFALVSKRSLLDAEMNSVTLDDSEEYADLNRRIETCEGRLSSTLSALDESDFRAALRDLDRPAAPDDEDAFFDHGP